MFSVEVQEVSSHQKGRPLSVLVDSGAEAHVCPKWFGQQEPIQAPRNTIKLRGAGGHELKFYGTRQISFRTFDQQKITLTFLVADVQRPKLSVGKLLQRGYRVRFHDEETAFIENRNGMQLMMTRDKNSYVLRVRTFCATGAESRVTEAVLPG